MKPTDSITVKSRRGPTTALALAEQNRGYAGTRGVGENCSPFGFVPAFRDNITEEVVLSRFADGRTALVHLLDGLPEHWVLRRDRRNRVVSVRSSIIAGFVRNGRFYTRADASRMRFDS